MKHIFFLLLVLISFSCQNKEKKEPEPDLQVIEKEDYSPIIEKFYRNKINDSTAVVLASTVTFQTTIKNPNPNDDWTEECLQKVDRKAIVGLIYGAIYAKKAVAYDYRTEEALSIQEVKKLEKKFDQNYLAQLQFVEEWYFDEQNFRFSKRVNALTLAYERFDDSRNLSGYVAAFKVFFNDGKSD